MRVAVLTFSLGLPLLAGCAGNLHHTNDRGAAPATTPADLAAPIATRQPVQLERHGDVRVDNWYWLNQRDSPEVLAYLEAENGYAEAQLAPVAALRETIYQEIIGRLPPQDDTVPTRQGEFEYWTHWNEGEDYAQWVRRATGGTKVEVILDGPSLYQGGYLSIVGVEPDPSHRLVAFAIDEVGRRVYTLRFRDLNSGALLEDEIPNASGKFVWANDNSVLYTTRDPITLRADRVLRHQLGSDPTTDVELYFEADETFSLTLDRSRSGQYLFIVSEQSLTSEWRLLDADAPLRPAAVLLPRERGHEYSVEHAGDSLWIRTNDNALDFRLMRAPVGPFSRSSWTEVIPARPDVLLSQIHGFRDFVALSERFEGLRRLRILPLDGREPWTIALGPEAQVAWIGDNAEWAPERLQIGLSGLATPISTYDYDLDTRALTLLKQEAVAGDFETSAYRSQRLQIPARDGAMVPVSLVQRRDLGPGPHPLLVYGYGAYGMSLEPSFNAARLSLLDRGFVFAIAHVRGGQELGRGWYEGGKLEHKQNTFNDFIDVSSGLIGRGFTRPGLLFAEGRSAGGLLAGVVATQRPDLYRGVIAGVPFVDVVTTMLDETIPLTTFEYDEWGNPNEPEAYRRMLAYSPYDNVTAQHYPALLVLTGYHDSQVQYWEPAKWVAKLRATKAGDEPLLFVTNLEAGHGGAAGRLRRHRDTALAYSFLVGLVDGRL